MDANAPANSGSDGLILYAGIEANSGLLKQATLQGSGVSKAQRAFAVLPAQDMQIGTRTLNHVYFVTPVRQTAESYRTALCLEWSP